MNFSHFHVSVTDLKSAVDWFQNIGQMRPNFQNDRMASIPFGNSSLILDKSEGDSIATIAFESPNCDSDHAILVKRGAVSISAPEDQAWGVRAAYVKGPGGLVIEVEQPLP